MHPVQYGTLAIHIENCGFNWGVNVRRKTNALNPLSIPQPIDEGDTITLLYDDPHALAIVKSFTHLHFDPYNNPNAKAEVKEYLLQHDTAKQFFQGQDELVTKIPTNVDPYHWLDAFLKGSPVIVQKARPA